MMVIHILWLVRYITYYTIGFINRIRTRGLLIIFVQNELLADKYHWPKVRDWYFLFFYILGILFFCFAWFYLSGILFFFIFCFSFYVQSTHSFKNKCYVFTFLFKSFLRCTKCSRMFRSLKSFNFNKDLFITHIQLYFLVYTTSTYCRQSGPDVTCEPCSWNCA